MYVRDVKYTAQMTKRRKTYWVAGSVYEHVIISLSNTTTNIEPDRHSQTLTSGLSQASRLTTSTLHTSAQPAYESRIPSQHTPKYTRKPSYDPIHKYSSSELLAALPAITFAIGARWRAISRWQLCVYVRVRTCYPSSSIYPNVFCCWSCAPHNIRSISVELDDCAVSRRERRKNREISFSSRKSSEKS